ncbi:MAG: PIN domain-containing protein, partial [Pseudonocardia sp.]|nr:PIN domain-containing protein [Pseudonocardia sp.]
MTLVLDSGGVSLLAASTADTARFRLRFGWPALVPSVVLAESLTGDHRRDHATNGFLQSCSVVDVDEHDAREAARLRTLTGRAGTITAVDAIVAALAARHREPVVLTGDPGDLGALVAHSRVPVTII